MEVLYIGGGEDRRLPSLLIEKGFTVKYMAEQEVLRSFGRLTQYRGSPLALIVEDGPSSLALIRQIRPFLNAPIVYSVGDEADAVKVVLALLECGADGIVPREEPMIAVALFSAIMRRPYYRS